MKVLRAKKLHRISLTKTVINHDCQCLHFSVASLQPMTSRNGSMDDCVFVSGAVREFSAETFGFSLFALLLPCGAGCGAPGGFVCSGHTCCHDAGTFDATVLEVHCCYT